MASVKPEPEAAGMYMDDEFYEDAGEMAMPARSGDDDVWLARIPDWLYSAVSQWDDLAEGSDNDMVQIGEVVAFATTTGIDPTKSMRLFLNDAWRAKTNLPTAYELEPANTSAQLLANTYVFSEKDLPGYKPAAYAMGYGNRGPAVQDPRARVHKRSKYKKAIPKQTALIGHATRQYLANPLETRAYTDFSTARIKQAVQGSNTETNITTDTDYINSNAVQKRFESFIKPTHKAKAQQNKASRVSKEELRDMLHAAFDEYQYWPMKALKARTRQPESFLKEGLQELAQLVKSGSFASTWQRLPMYSEARNLSQQQSGAAAAPEDADAGDSEDEMEDVV